MYRCLDENEPMERGDIVVYADGYTFPVTGYAGLCPQDMITWGIDNGDEALVSVLRPE